MQIAKDKTKSLRILGFDFCLLPKSDSKPAPRSIPFELIYAQGRLKNEPGYLETWGTIKGVLEVWKSEDGLEVRGACADIVELYSGFCLQLIWSGWNPSARQKGNPDGKGGACPGQGRPTKT